MVGETAPGRRGEGRGSGGGLGGPTRGGGDAVEEVGKRGLVGHGGAGGQDAMDVA